MAPGGLWRGTRGRGRQRRSVGKAKKKVQLGRKNSERDSEKSMPGRADQTWGGTQQKNCHEIRLGGELGGDARTLCENSAAMGERGVQGGKGGWCHKQPMGKIRKRRRWIIAMKRKKKLGGARKNIEIKRGKKRKAKLVEKKKGSQWKGFEVRELRPGKTKKHNFW